jgi:hypothetical protein
MSSNRLMYDACTYESKVKTSTGPYQYAIYNGKFENSSKCTIERNVVGGNHVSLYSGNLVDLESDLRGQTRLASKCPSRKYTPKTLDMTSHHGLNHVQNCNRMI